MNQGGTIDLYSSSQNIQSKRNVLGTMFFVEQFM